MNQLVLRNDGFENIPEILLAHGFEKVLSAQIEPPKRKFNTFNYYEIFTKGSEYKLVHINSFFTGRRYREIGLKDLESLKYDKKSSDLVDMFQSIIEKQNLEQNINDARASKTVKL